jgi:hypothetical protein
LLSPRTKTRAKTESIPHHSYLTSLTQSHPIAIDSGASSTIIRDLDRFTPLNFTRSKQNIKTSDKNAVLTSHGYGAITITLPDEKELKIDKAFYCPNAPINLLSTNDLEAAGLYFVSTNGNPGRIYQSTNQQAATPHPGDVPVAKTIKRYGLHFLPEHSNPKMKFPTRFIGMCANAFYSYKEADASNERVQRLLAAHEDTRNQARLMHARLGHVGQQKMQHIRAAATLPDLQIPKVTLESNFCHSCTMAKRNRAPFASQPQQDTKPGEYLGMDVVQMSVASYNMSYALIVVCYSSRYTWIYPLPAKNFALIFAIRVILYIKTEWDTAVKSIRLDRGELHSEAFNRFCESNGVKPEFTPRKTPQSDGMAERHIRTLVEMTMALLFHAKLPPIFWVDAMRHACFLVNRLPVTHTAIASPYETVNHVAPRADFLRVFGCAALYRLDKTDHKKTEPKVKIGIYVGAQSASQAKLIDLSTGKHLIRRFADIVFNEASFPKSNQVPECDYGISSNHAKVTFDTAFTEDANEYVSKYLAHRNRFSSTEIDDATLVRELRRRYIPVSERPGGRKKKQKTSQPVSEPDALMLLAGGGSAPPGVSKTEMGPFLP